LGTKHGLNVEADLLGARIVTYESA
jgi:hypothetical protein